MDAKLIDTMRGEIAEAEKMMTMYAAWNELRREAEVKASNLRNELFKAIGGPPSISVTFQVPDHLRKIIEKYLLTLPAVRFHPETGNPVGPSSITYRYDAKGFTCYWGDLLENDRETIAAQHVTKGVTFDEFSNYLETLK